MGAITTILAKNLPPAAQVRIGAAQTYLDTPAGFSIRLSKDVERLSDLNKIKVEGALRTNLDFTPTNDAVLIEYYTPLTVDRRGRWIDVSVFVEGLPTQFTRMYVIRKDEGRRQWEVEFALPADHWAELATQKKINTIEVGTYYLSKTNVLSTWAAPKYEGDFTPTVEGGTGWNPAYWWVLGDFGGWVDQKQPAQNTTAPVKMVAVEDLRPLISLVYLLKRGFCEIGWTLNGLIFETEWALRLWVHLLKDRYFDSVNDLGAGFEIGRNGRIIGRQLDSDFGIVSVSSPILFDTVEFVLGTNSLPYAGGTERLAGIQNNYPFHAKFNFQIKFELQNFNGSASAAGFVIGEVTGAQNNVFTGELLSQTFEFDLGAGTTDWISFDVEVTLEPGQKACLLHQYGVSSGDKVKKGAWFRIDPANDAYSRFDYIDLRYALHPDFNLLDCLKAFVHLCNGRIETDYTARTITVHPERAAMVYADTVPGFVQDSENTESIDDRVIDGSVQLRYIRPDLLRYTQLSFADSTDAYVDSLNLLEPLHSRKINNGEDLPDDVDERQNPLFEPTAEVQPTELRKPGRSPSPYLPCFWDNTDGGTRSQSIGPRILYAFGNVKQVNPTPVSTVDEFAEFYFDGYTETERVSTFGYATQLRTWELDPAPDPDGSVVFGRTANDLFVNFYLGITNDNRGGVEVDLLQMMTMRDYARYNFRGLFTLNYQGRKLRMPMTAIRDFTPGIPTPVTYFAQPVETTCCDLPCSCRFRTCDYYQDFGVLLAQSTLNDLRVTSFKIDDKEILTAPVEFGSINIIDIAGRPYVTNLVDTLNSIGAPYFAFGYSTRVHAQKGMRFFTIKHPACQGFEIIISDIADPVYRYTHDAQQEQWFAGSWGAIGYGGETFTAPDNCETTIEY